MCWPRPCRPEPFLISVVSNADSPHEHHFGFHLKYFLLLSLLSVASHATAQTALDAYVAHDDGVFAYEEYDDDTGIGWTTRLFKMTSQRWRGDEDVDCERRLENSWLDACDLWQHEVIMYIPETIRLGSLGGTEHTAVLLINGGSNSGELIRSGNEFGGPLAVITNAVIVELRQVPNQPYYFDAEPGRKRSEDELLGYSIDRYFDAGDPTWPALAPMTKAAVRAMDAVQQFIREKHDHDIDDFVVIGGSKRGWTTWLTAAVDDRVKAIMPASIEVHELQKQLEHQHASYGFFAPATADYVEANLACQLPTDTSGTLRELIDPAVYNDRYTMPKLILNSTGDQFFTSDSSRFYYQNLPEPKQIRMAPNTDHKQSSEAIVSGLGWLLDAIDDDLPGEQIQWSIDPDGTLRVATQGNEESVLLWEAHNPDARDFRLESLGEAWVGSELAMNANGEYVAPPVIRETGWTARIIEVQYETIDLPGLDPVIESYTTEVQILPDTLPFEPFDCSKPMNIEAGMWWDPATNGQGIDVNRFNETLIFGPWYLYDENGSPFWVTFTGQLEGTRALGELREYNGPMFGPGFDLDFDPNLVSERIAGQGTMAFLSTGNGVFHYGFDVERGGFHHDLNIEEIDDRPNGPRSGHYFNPEQPGHGFQFNHKDDVLFGTWYSYDANGEPTWYLFVGTMTDANNASGDVYGYTGPPLGNGPWQEELLEETPVGDIFINFDGDDSATVTITVNDVTGQYPVVRIGS